jgi:hypothetical protein
MNRQPNAEETAHLPGRSWRGSRGDRKPHSLAHEHSHFNETVKRLSRLCRPGYFCAKLAPETCP